MPQLGHNLIHYQCLNLDTILYTINASTWTRSDNYQYQNHFFLIILKTALYTFFTLRYLRKAVKDGKRQKNAKASLYSYGYWDTLYRHHFSIKVFLSTALSSGGSVLQEKDH